MHARTPWSPLLLDNRIENLVGYPVLRGHRAIHARWFPQSWLDEAARQRQIVEAWRPGCRAYRFSEGDLLCYPQAQIVDCDEQPGWPLQRVSGALCSAAIKPSDLAGRSVADVWLAVGGALRGLRLSDATTLDPSRWFTFEQACVETFDLRMPETARTLAVPPTRELRQVLGSNVPEAASEDSLGFLQALKRRAQSQGGSNVRSNSAPLRDRVTASLSPWALLAGAAIAAIVLMFIALDGLPNTAQIFRLFVFLAMMRWLWSIAGRSGLAVRAAARMGAPGNTNAQESIRARMAKRAPQRWRSWASRLTMSLALQRLLGAQHAAYVRRMLAMFDEGRIDEALRHALPLGDDSGSLGQAFGNLRPRKDLSLRSQRGVSSSINFGQSFEQHLRTLYRRTFERLDGQGRIDEATFVLAELLRARQEALDYLERHGRFHQAAELAFGWDMPSVQIVRLQALAGQWRQAVLVAQRDNVFAEAVVMLEQRWPEAAARLRLEWSDSLAAQARWLDAVQALWPLASERSRAAEWLDHVEAAGGTLAARALALRVQFQPESLASHGALISALRDDPALSAERAVLARELLKTKPPVEPALRRLAGLTVGMTIADQSGSRPTLDAKTLQSLISFSNDAPLAADMPDSGSAWPGAMAQPVMRNVEAMEWPVPLPGTLPLFDAVPLADGEFLVALGEAGAARLDARGRRLVHFDTPAHRLVISADGTSALALAPRERVWRVTRLDLSGRATVDLGLHAFDAFADRFDGAGWTVGVGRSMQVLDTTTRLSEVLWQVTDLPGPVIAITSSHDTELLILQDDDAVADVQRLQQWNYALPKRRLRSRDTVPLFPPSTAETTVRRLLAGRIGLIDLHFDARTAGRARFSPAVSPTRRWTDIVELDPTDAMAGADGWLLARSDRSIRLIELASGQVRGRWHWPAEAVVGLRGTAGMWVVFDREGRLATVDLETGFFHACSVR